MTSDDITDPITYSEQRISDQFAHMRVELSRGHLEPVSRTLLSVKGDLGLIVSMAERTLDSRYTTEGLEFDKALIDYYSELLELASNGLFLDLAKLRRKDYNLESRENPGGLPRPLLDADYVTLIFKEAKFLGRRGLEYYLVKAREEISVPETREGKIDEKIEQKIRDYSEAKLVSFPEDRVAEIVIENAHDVYETFLTKIIQDSQEGNYTGEKGFLALQKDFLIAYECAQVAGLGWFKRRKLCSVRKKAEREFIGF